jgi:hypothetical protein
MIDLQLQAFNAGISGSVGPRLVDINLRTLGKRITFLLQPAGM